MFKTFVNALKIKDIRTKSLRSNNPCNVVRATINGLASLKSAEEVAAKRGKTVKEILDTLNEEQQAAVAEYVGYDNANGWDGTYNGNPLPSTDYWYQIDIEEINMQYVGHFTLIRR